jgi:hypothetical protein
MNSLNSKCLENVDLKTKSVNWNPLATSMKKPFSWVANAFLVIVLVASDLCWLLDILVI